MFRQFENNNYSAKFIRSALPKYYSVIKCVTGLNTCKYDNLLISQYKTIGYFVLCNISVKT